LQFVSKNNPDYQYLSQDKRHYSNLGYGMLGMALERAAGMDYQEYILSKICEPLNLTNTGFGTFSSKGNTIAKGYHYTGEVDGFIKTPDYYPNSMVYAAGMYSSASDLAKFISAQLSDHN